MGPHDPGYPLEGNWPQFLALFGVGIEDADFTLRLKQTPLSRLYVAVVLALVLLFEVLPYAEELARFAAAAA